MIDQEEKRVLTIYLKNKQIAVLLRFVGGLNFHASIEETASKLLTFHILSRCTQAKKSKRQ